MHHDSMRYFSRNRWCPVKARRYVVSSSDIGRAARSVVLKDRYCRYASTLWKLVNRYEVLHSVSFSLSVRSVLQPSSVQCQSSLVTMPGTLWKY